MKLSMCSTVLTDAGGILHGLREGNMTRMLEIESCKECPKYVGYSRFSTPHCEHQGADREVLECRSVNPLRIPEWCPLPTKKKSGRGGFI